MKITDLLNEDWQKVNKHDKTDGLSQKAVNAYRRENPGSKLKTAVTTKPSKLKKGSKAAKRRKSFCARMGGMKKAHASAKTKRDPDSPINKALRRWNCESIEDMRQLIEYAEQVLAEDRARLNEFAPDDRGESGRWYTDDQMTDIVGDGWWQDLDISGDIPKQEMIEEAQLWLMQHGYRVRVLNVRVNDDDCDWFIEGSFQKLNEFAPDDSNGGEEETLHKYARMWYQGDEGTQQQIEQVLARMGWEIGEIESEEGGAFVVQSGDEHGNSYIGFAPDDLSENFADGRNPQDKGDSKRYGINTKASVSSLRKTAKQGGRKGQLAHWLANMKAGRAK